MADVPRPDPPTPVSGLPEEEQAKIMIQDYTEAIAYGAQVEAHRQALIEWIERLIKELQQARSTH